MATRAAMLPADIIDNNLDALQAHLETLRKLIEADPRIGADPKIAKLAYGLLVSLAHVAGKPVDDLVAKYHSLP